MPLEWRKSTFCASTGCVEVARHTDSLLVRDSKRLDSPVLTFSNAEWGAFVREIKNGNLNAQ